nr:D-arabinono-1,4-lactone oxidase [Arthrobacter sp. 35W]
MEYAVPLELLPEVLRELDRMINRGGFSISFPVEVRCAAKDDIPLSTAQGRDSGYIAVHQYWRTDPFDFFHSAEKLFLSYGGRPHWGKWHFLHHDALDSLYPQLKKFCSVRESADPMGVFRNAYVDRVLPPLPSGT